MHNGESKCEEEVRFWKFGAKDGEIFRDSGGFLSMDNLPKSYFDCFDTS